MVLSVPPQEGQVSWLGSQSWLSHLCFHLLLTTSLFSIFPHCVSLFLEDSHDSQTPWKWLWCMNQISGSIWFSISIVNIGFYNTVIIRESREKNGRKLLALGLLETKCIRDQFLFDYLKTQNAEADQYCQRPSSRHVPHGVKIYTTLVCTYFSFQKKNPLNLWTSLHIKQNNCPGDVRRSQEGFWEFNMC